jgi:hypothetical protein
MRSYHKSRYFEMSNKATDFRSDLVELTLVVDGLRIGGNGVLL